MVDITHIKKQEKEIHKQQEIILKKETEKVQNELNLNQRELTANTLSIVRYSALITDIINEFITVKRFTNKHGIKLIDSIASKIHLQSSENNLKEFELRFKKVHTLFYEKLNEKFPLLTPNDKTLCAFLRLNMTSKQISSVTLKSLRSIDNARSRLRKN